MKVGQNYEMAFVFSNIENQGLDFIMFSNNFINCKLIEQCNGCVLINRSELVLNPPPIEGRAIEFMLKKP